MGKGALRESGQATGRVPAEEKPYKVQRVRWKVPESEVGDFAEAAGGDVVDEAADGDGLRNPGMSAKFLELVADIFVDVLKGEEEGGGDGGGAGAVLNASAEVLLAGVHEAAVGVVDDHKLFGAEEVMRDEEGAERIVGDDAAGIANDVGVSGFEAEGADGEARVHTSEDGEFALGARGEAAEFVGAGIDFVGNKDFVDDRHGGS